jgi:hypothetical protein
MIGINLAKWSHTLKFLSDGVVPIPGGYVMRPTKRLFLFALTIFLLFGTVPVVNAQTTADAAAVETVKPDFLTAEPVICGDPAVSGSIDSADDVDVYSIEDLVAGQVVTIDVDTALEGKDLDTILHVYADTDPGTTDDTEVSIASSDSTPGNPSEPNEDPYLELTIQKDGTYYLVIYDALNGDSIVLDNSYTLSLKCTDPSTDPVEKVKVGDLLGATGTDSGSLLTIDPVVDAKSTDRFPFGFGPVTDIEFDPTNGILFAATHAETGSLFAINPNNKDEIKDVELNSGSIIALEAADGKLYGVRLVVDSLYRESFSLVTIDRENLGIITEVTISQRLRSLAYHSVDKAMYGVSGTDLFKISLTTSPVQIDEVGPTGLLEEIVALDFSNDNVLYAVDRPGNLYTIPYLNLATDQPVNIGTISAVAELPYVPTGPYSAAINGLTFVIGEPPEDVVEPIKTICSSTLTSPMTASSETAGHKLSRFKRKNHLRRAIGLFKFQATAGESVTIRLALEEEGSTEVEKESKVNRWWRWKYWPKYKRKGRVFLGVRDSIPGVDLRVRKKDTLPMDLEVMNLPADGSYYIMVIRPLFRLHKADYCLTLESDDPESQAWQTLQVAWPNDDSERNPRRPKHRKAY